MIMGMKRLLIGTAAAFVLAACSEQPAPTPVDVEAGKAFVEAHCTGCNTLQGEGKTEEIPNLAAQPADYLVEAKYLRDYRELVSGDPEFLVPEVHDDLTTRHVLAMEYVHGEPLESLGEEGVYQATMARLASPHEPLRYSADIVGRAVSATRQLLLPQLTPRKLLLGLTGSRVIF